MNGRIKMMVRSSTTGRYPFTKAATSPPFSVAIHDMPGTVAGESNNNDNVNIHI